MHEHLIPVGVRIRGALDRTVEQIGAGLRRSWDDRSDETGVDEAVTKMLWLAVGIGVAVAATAFFVDVFEGARANVPDPVAPMP
jgi:class 3 adenylate cyclase